MALNHIAALVDHYSFYFCTTKVNTQAHIGSCHGIMLVKNIVVVVSDDFGVFVQNHIRQTLCQERCERVDDEGNNSSHSDSDSGYIQVIFSTGADTTQLLVVGIQVKFSFFKVHTFLP